MSFKKFLHENTQPEFIVGKFKDKDGDIVYRTNLKTTNFEELMDYINSNEDANDWVRGTIGSNEGLSDSTGRTIWWGSDIQDHIEAIAYDPTRDNYMLDEDLSDHGGDLKEANGALTEDETLEDVPQLDKVALFQDLADIESNMSDAFSKLYAYKEQHIPSPELQDALSKLRAGVNDLLKKVGSVMSYMGVGGQDTSGDI